MPPFLLQKELVLYIAIAKESMIHTAMTMPGFTCAQRHLLIIQVHLVVCMSQTEVFLLFAYNFDTNLILIVICELKSYFHTTMSFF